MADKAFGRRDSGPLALVPVYVASLAMNMTALLTPLAILLIFDRVIPNQSLNTLTMLGLLLLGAAVVDYVLRWSRTVLLNVDAEGASRANHRTFLSKVLRANPVAFATVSPAVNMERHGALARIRDHLSGQNRTLAIDMPFIAVFLLMIALIGGWLVLVPLTGLLGIFAYAAVVKSVHGSIFSARKTLDNRRYGFLAEVFDKTATVKVNTMERQMIRRFEMLENQTVDNSHRLIRLSGFSQAYGAVFSQFMVAAMGLFGAFLVIKELIGIAELAACMMLNGRVLQPLVKLISLWLQAENVSASKQRLAELDAIPAQARRSEAKTAMRGLVEASRLSFAPQGGSAQGIDRATFRVEPGMIAHIEAADAADMDAFIDLAAGHKTPDAGTLFIDGLLPSDRAGQRGTGALAVLERPPALFSGTLIENLSAFGDAAQVDRAIDLAHQLGLDRRIHRLPRGYQTEMNAGSVFDRDPVNRQLVAMVRVLALSPKLVLMNAPTAMLDVAERDLFAACLTKLDPKPTLLVASPDPRIKRVADLCINLAPARSEALLAWEDDAAREARDAARLREGVA